VHRLLSQLAAEGVIGESLDVLAEAILVKRLDRVQGPRVKIDGVVRGSLMVV